MVRLRHVCVQASEWVNKRFKDELIQVKLSFDLLSNVVPLKQLACPRWCIQRKLERNGKQRDVELKIIWNLSQAR